MPYIRNLKSGSIRLGRGEDGVVLEPETVVTSVDPKTRNRKSRPGENVAYVSDEKYNNMTNKFKRSEGVLFELIDEQTFNERIEVLDQSHTDEASKPMSIPGPADPNGPNADQAQMEVRLDNSAEQDLLRIPMDKDTLELQEGIVGGEFATRSRPDPAQGGKTLTEVRRSQDAEARPIDPSVLEQMGKGENA